MSSLLSNRGQCHVAGTGTVKHSVHASLTTTLGKDRHYDEYSISVLHYTNKLFTMELQEHPGTA